MSENKPKEVMTGEQKVWTIFALCAAAVVVVLFCLIAADNRNFQQSQERIKLAKIAAATSQYCDCLKLIEVE